MFTLLFSISGTSWKSSSSLLLFSFSLLLSSSFSSLLSSSLSSLLSSLFSSSSSSSSSLIFFTFFLFFFFFFWSSSSSSLFWLSSSLLSSSSNSPLIIKVIGSFFFLLIHFFLSYLSLIKSINLYISFWIDLKSKCFNLCSQYLFAISLLIFLKFFKTFFGHKSKLIDFIFVTWTPISLWQPEQFIHTKTPKFIEAHEGEGLLQSAHKRFSGFFNNFVITFIWFWRSSLYFDDILFLE